MKEKNEKRLDFLLEQIQLNPRITREEIDHKLMRRSSYGHMADERGRESVANAIDILISQPQIVSISEIERHTEYDRQGRDLQVEFDTNLGWPYHLRSVWVQVKSSEAGVQNFRIKHDEGYLLQNSLVVLNARQSDEEILEDFWKQVDGIYHYRLGYR